MVKVAPSILSADFSNMGAAVEMLEAAGADYIHCDVMDGHFVPNITFGQQMVKDIKKRTVLPLDVHLMVTDPEKHIDGFIDAGADIVTVHTEATVHVQRALEMIRKRGAKAGAVLNPHTPPDMLQYLYDDMDIILLMSVNPGFAAQKFLPAVIEKAKIIRAELDRRGLKTEIEMDGGVNLQNAPKIIEAGVDVLVAGNAVFTADDPKQAIRALKEGK